MDQVGPYRIGSLLGRGTTGSVHRADRLGPVRQVVAIKRARPDAVGDVDRLRREAAVLADLDHPHIVRVLDVLEDGGDVAIVMPLAQGGSLHDLLHERHHLTAGQTVALLAPVADALDSAHRRGVLHGDVKPANILFTSDGEPLLGDFGVAQTLLGDLPHLNEGSRQGLRAVEGTAGYVDPELVATGRPEPRNDIYGLAAVAYVCLTGGLPHPGDDSATILGAAERGDHQRLTDLDRIPVDLADAVEAALSRRIDDRPLTAGELARALRGSVPLAEVALPGPPERPGVAAVAGSDDELITPAPGMPRRGEGAPGAPDDGEVIEPVGAADPLAAGRRGEVDGTRAFGPRPPTTEETRPRSRPLLALMLVVVVLAAAVAAGLVARGRLTEELEPAGVEVAGGARPAAVECPDHEPLPLTGGAIEIAADVEGNGCVTTVVWTGQVMRFRRASDGEVQAFDFSQADGNRSAGQLLFGDWDCDGADSPALYRPSTGSVAYFSGVPSRVGGEVVADVQSSGVMDGRAALVPGDGDDCDRVEVERAA